MIKTPSQYLPASAGKRPLTHRAARLGAAAALVTLGACALASDAPAARVQLEQLTRNRQCQQDSECRSVGIGRQACGGPQQFLPWSTRHTETKALEAAVARYSEQRLKQIASDGEMSTCAVLPDPGARCERAPGAVTGQCVLRSAPDGALR